MARKDFPYVTHLGLVLNVEQEDEEYEEDWVVTLTGDRTKILARSDKTFCYEVAEREMAHYKQRALDEAVT